MANYRSELDKADGRIAYKLLGGLDGIRAVLKSATELEYELMLSNYSGTIGTRS